jgi:hypothetical protein
MAKRRKQFKTVPPSWFPLSETRPSGFQDLHVTPEGFPEWVSWARLLLRQPAFRALWRSYLVRRAELPAIVEAMPWPHIDGWTLVTNVEECASTRRGLENFLPEPVREHVDAETRHVLFLLTIFAGALEAVLDPAERMLTPELEAALPPERREPPGDWRDRMLLLWLRRDMAFLAGARAAKEITRRAEDRTRGHVGLNAALLLLSDPAHVLLGRSLPTPEEALERLVRTCRATNAGLLRTLDPNLRDREAQRAEVVSQIGESLPKHWYGADGFELLARGANGELNGITGRDGAVRRDLLDAVRKKGRERRRFEVRFGERRLEDSSQGLLDEIPSAEETPIERAVKRALLRQVVSDPGGRELLQAIASADDDRQETRAKMLNRTPRTIRNRIAAVRRNAADLL